MPQFSQAVISAAFFSALLISGSALAASPQADNAATIGQGLAQTLKAELWKDAPEWLARTEVDLGWRSGEGGEFSLLTTQPLWQSHDKVHTFLFQASTESYQLYDIRRQAVNIGTGYRRLLLDNQLMVGVNSFGDYEVNYGHSRVSFGFESKYGPLDLNFNRYVGIGGAEQVRGLTERTMDGLDVELGTTAPYLPWLSVYGRYFEWYKEVGSQDTHGSAFSTEMNLLPNVGLIAGTEDDDRNERNNYVKLRLRLAANGQPTLIDTPVSAKAWQPRDLTSHTLDKVRRENRIMTERSTTTGAGLTVVIARGS